MTTNQKAAGCANTRTACKQLPLSADYTPDQVAEARHRLRDAITATGLPAFQGVAILASAESYVKAATQALAATSLAVPAPEALTAQATGGPFKAGGALASVGMFLYGSPDKSFADTEPAGDAASKGGAA